MPEWNDELRPRLARLRLTPAREAEIVEELSQHLDDRYQELRAAGRSESEARQLAIAELLDEDAIAQRMRPLRQATSRRRSRRAHLVAAWQATCSRISATRCGCCTSSQASPPPPW